MLLEKIHRNTAIMNIKDKVNAIILNEYKFNGIK